ncbi:hypothetical protein MW887_010328 [Aspergillus wentii]|nr:hypothetical protein MW887_010328 [Aspergillus wentii]
MSFNSYSPQFPQKLDLWCDVFAAYCRQLGEKGEIDEEVLVALLHAKDDDRYLSHERIQLAVAQLPRECFRMCQEVAIELAAVADSEKVMATIFNRRDECIKVTEDMLLAAAGNRWHGEEVTNYLLRLSPANITHEVIIRVLENSRAPSENLRSLVRQLGNSIDITEDLLIAASEVEGYGNSGLMGFLKIHSAPPSFSSYICEAALIAAAKNSNYGGRIMRELLETSGPLPITEEVLVWASHTVKTGYKLSGSMIERHIMDLLVRKGIDRKPPSIEFLETAFSMFEPCVLAFMIELYKGLIEINTELVSYSLDGADFREIQKILTAKGLVSDVNAKSTIHKLPDKADHHCGETDSIDSMSEKSEESCADITLTAEMVQSATNMKRQDGHETRIYSLLGQQTRTVIVTAEAIPAIIKYDDLSTIKLLVSGNNNIVIPSVLQFSLSNTRVEDIQHASFQSEIAVTDHIICAAIENTRDQNLAILGFLFVLFGCPTIISNRVLVAAASLEHNPTNVLEFLLCCNQGEIDGLESIAVAAAGNHTDGDHLLMLLFDHFGDEIQLSERLLVAAAENENTKHALLQCLSSPNCQVTPKVLAAAACNTVFAVEMMKMLLQRFQTPITESVLIEAARSGCLGDKLLDLFLEERRYEFRLTEKVIEGFIKRTAYCNDCTGHSRVPETFLDPSYYVDPYSVQTAAILSKSLSYSQFNVFLSNYQLVNPQDLALELAQECNDVTLRMILERYGFKISMSEALLKRAARNTHSRTNILKVFIFSGENIGQVAEITPDVVAAAAENPKYGYESVQLLRTRCSEAPFVDSKTILAAVSNQAEFSLRLLRLLFRCSQCSLPITTELLSTAAKNSKHGTEMLRLLLSRLEKQGDDQINFEDVLKVAAANTTVSEGWADFSYIWHSPLGLLIRKKRDRITITESVLTAAAANSENGKRCFLLLMKYAGEGFAITENVVCAAARNPEQWLDILTIILDHPTYQDVDVSEKVLTAAVGNDVRRFQFQDAWF